MDAEAEYRPIRGWTDVVEKHQEDLGMRNSNGVYSEQTEINEAV